MKVNRLKGAANCPIIFYSHFVIETSESMVGTVTIERFENDIVYFKSKGYSFLSIDEIDRILREDKSVPEKSLCLAFVDGFESEYLLAFDVLKRHNVHCDIFLCPNLVGIKDKTTIPRFDWLQAREMCESGLVNIHAFRHETQCNISIDKVAYDASNKIREKLGASNGTSFLNTIGDSESIDLLHELQKLGLKTQLIFYKQLCAEAISKGCFGHISMENEFSVQESEALIISYANCLLANIDSEVRLIEGADTAEADFLKNNPETIEIEVLKNPVIINRPHIAFPLSVLNMSSYDKYAEFATLEFLPFMAIPSTDYLDFDCFDYRTWPMLDTHYLGAQILKYNKINPLKYIHTALLNGFCADVCIDAYYIPGKSFFHKRHISHNILVFGYDAANAVFKTLTHINTGKYTTLDVHIEYLLRACSTNFFEYIILLKKNHWSYFSYNRDTIKQLLTEYLDAEEMVCYSKWCKDFHGKKIIGLKAGEWLSKEISENTGGHINYANLVAYTEHKKCMAWRLKYISEREAIDLGAQIENLDILEKSESIIGLCIKYDITRSEYISKSIACKIECINKAERAIINELVNQL